MGVEQLGNGVQDRRQDQTTQPRTRHHRQACGEQTRLALSDA